jgi:hypothetical protein
MLFTHQRFGCIDEDDELGAQTFEGTLSLSTIAAGQLAGSTPTTCISSTSLRWYSTKATATRALMPALTAALTPATDVPKSVL